jgi:hypothetical protein
VAHGLAQADADALPGLRRQFTNRETLPANLTKHFDEQTLVALAAVGRAISDFRLPAERFRDWGVLAAPRFIGRVAMASSLKHFAAQGVWGISPHLVPHRSLHSLPGTLSVALKMHGPNLGIGGGPGGEAEAILTAATLLTDDRLPGLWLTLTGWDPEFAPDPDSLASPGSVCRGIALALLAARSEWQGPRLRVRLDEEASAWDTPPDEFNLEALRTALVGGPATWVWRLGTGGILELELPESERGHNA